LQMGLPADGERKHERMQCEHVEQCEHTILIQQQETHQHQRAREQMRNIAVERCHPHTLDTNSIIVPRSPNMSATPRKSGTRNTRILAMAVSNRTSRNANTVSFVA